MLSLTKPLFRLLWLLGQGREGRLLEYLHCPHCTGRSLRNSAPRSPSTLSPRAAVKSYGLPWLWATAKKTIFHVYLINVWCPEWEPYTVPGLVSVTSFSSIRSVLGWQ